MKRRALLGTLASLAVAGCTGANSPGTGGTTTTTATTNSPTTDPTTTDPTPTDEATPPELRALGVPASETDCPLGDDGRAVCYPEQTDAPLSLTPASAALDLPRASTTFTLANDTDYEYRANFYHWRLHKRENDDWYSVAPQMWPEPLHVLPAGESKEWSFTVDNGDAVTTGSSSESDVDLAGLGGGEYAFSVRGWFPLGDDENFHVSAGARFELRGDPVELTPAAGVSTTRDGDTVTVTTDAQPGEHEVMAAFVVTRSGVPPEQPLRRRITEQLLRPGPSVDGPNPYRNTLPFFDDGAETVRFEASASEHSPFGVDDPYYLGYDGETYRVSTDVLG
ncbi:MAG: hypothetical protein ABEJ88_08705 [Halobacterium sp.]